MIAITLVLIATACTGADNYSACSNECLSIGYKECQGTIPGTDTPRYFAECGNFDNDDCLEFKIKDCMGAGPAGYGWCDITDPDGCGVAGTTTSSRP